jgi:hypothetical protein
MVLTHHDDTVLPHNRGRMRLQNVSQMSRFYLAPLSRSATPRSPDWRQIMLRQEDERCK